MQQYARVLASLGGCIIATALSGCTSANPAGPGAGPFDATTDGPDSSAPATDDAGDDGGVNTGPCAPYDASGFSDAEIQAGSEIVTSLMCRHCHGQYLQGSSTPLMSTSAEGGVAYAPDLTPDPLDGLGCWTDPQIERAILQGIDQQGRPLCNPMPRWGEVDDGGIDEAGAEAVLAYLRTVLVSLNPTVPATGQCPAPVDDAGQDSGGDAGIDAATTDAAVDAASDAGTDAGPDADAG